MSSPPARSVHRLLAVLEAFDLDNPALSLTAISRRTELPLATTHRLAGALAEWGALERGEDGLYRVGLRLWELAALAPRGFGLRTAALPFLEDLYEATHENVQLAVRDGLDVVYIERLSARNAVGVRSQVGARWPLHATGVGLVLLAYGPGELQDEVCSGPLTAFTPYTVTDPTLLRRVLADVRRTGTATSDRQITDDAVSIAAAVRGPHADVVAAVSIVVPVDESRLPQLVPAVLVAARGISRALGWRPDRSAHRGTAAPGTTG